MDDGPALLRAVLERPDDDAPRLVYADWLEADAPPPDRDPARAEFIRSQVALAWGEPPNSGPLRRREAELWDAHWARWVVPVAAALGVELVRTPGPDPRWANAVPEYAHPSGEVADVRRWAFRRGFVESVTLSTAAFLDRAAALFADQPVADVRLADRRAWGGLRGPVATERGDLEAGPWLLQWYNGPAAEHRLPHRLPRELMAELFSSLPPDCRWRTWHDKRHGTMNCYFPAAAAADAALSAACVAYGRRRAGLPPRP